MGCPVDGYNIVQDLAGPDACGAVTITSNPVVWEYGPKTIRCTELKVKGVYINHR